MTTPTGIDRDSAKLHVGAGWDALLDTIYDKLPDNVTVDQVKEKYGGLRFYISGGDIALLDFIWEKENESLTICEVCGAPGEPRDTGWIKTLCDKCLEERLRGRQH